MLLTRPLRLGCLAVVAAMAARTAGAQDSLRVLRFSPAGPASLVDPVVVTFDHPVAPRLAASVDPARAITIHPAGGATAYWRDPSTLVVDFNHTRPQSTSYTVTLDPALRGAAGLPLARRDAATRTITIRGVQVLLAQSVRPDGLLDTLARVRVVVASQLQRDWTTLRSWLLLDRPCDATPWDSISFRVERVRAIDAGDDGSVQAAGGLDRDRRSDSLRRVMELVAERPLAGGCVTRFEVRRAEGGPLLYSRELRVRPRFALLPRRCGDGRMCAAGPFVIQFTAPVAASEIRANVRLNGVAPSVGGDSSSTTWRVHPGLRAGTEHTLQVSGALRSTRGEALGTDLSQPLRVAWEEPGISYPIGSYVLPRGAPMLIRVRHVNTDSVIVIVARVPDSARTRALQHRVWYTSTSWRTVAGDSVVLRYATRAAADSHAVLTVPTVDLPLAWRDTRPIAVRAVGVERPMRSMLPGTSVERVRPRNLIRGTSGSPDVPFAVLRRSDIAIHMLDAEGEVRVWVTSLRDARPLAAAQVRVVNGAGRELARATADAGGMAVLRYAVGADTSARARTLVVEARHDDDVNVQLVSERSSLPRVPGAAGGGDDDETGGDGEWYDDYRESGSLTRLHGAAFSERGIYRPGERVFLKGVVRRYDARAGYTTPRGDSARWVLRWTGDDGTEERVWTQRGRLGEFGSVVDTFMVPRTARLGSYLAKLSVARDGRWRTVASASFAVAEYRVPEFTVRATTDSAVPLFARDTARVEIAARYLFGVPMQQARVEWWVRTTESDPWDVKVRGLEGFGVGRAWWLLPDGMARNPDAYARGELKAGDDGRAVVHAPLGMLSRPGRMTVHATVTDANRQTVTGDLSVPVHAADVYVGARLAQPRWVWPAGEAIPVQALVVGADGTRRPGLPVRLLAIRYGWQSDRWRADTVWRDSRTSTADTLRVAFTPESPGQYELLLTVRDRKGREATTGVFAWVTSPDSRYARAMPARLTLAADKPRYDAGDRAAIRVESNDDGPAWVTLSREGILWEGKVQLRRGTNVVVVPIPADASPGAELSVVALRSRTAADTSDVYYQHATIRLEVGRDAHLLHVTVVPDRVRYQPRDTVRLQVGVKDAAGHAVRSELAVWAVDEGVASLTAMESPDLLLSLLTVGANPYSFATTLAAMLPRLVPDFMMRYGTVTRLRGAAPARRIPVRMDVPAPEGLLSQVVVVGTGTAPAPAALRQVFSTTPLYRGAVLTDIRGNAAVEFVLPDNLTTFRVFAVAIAEGARAGNGDIAIVSTRTLAVRPALPRVIRDGDSLLAGAVVTQDRDGRTPLTLRAEATGVRITGPAALTDSLDGRRVREIRFGLRGITADTAVIRFYGNTRLDADAAEARLPVSPAGHSRAHVAMGTLTGSARLGFRIDEPIDTTRSRLEVQVGSSPVPLLQRLSESLRLYPYYCTEQLSSSGRAMVARLRAERMVAPAAALSLRDRAQLEMGVATIVARQREDGGFGYWSATNWTSPWLTSYALEFLDGARELGVDVPAGALARARGYLTEAGPLAQVTRYGANGTNLRRDSLVQPHEALAAALTLRSMHHPDTTLERRVLLSARAFGWVDRLSLARLLAVRGDSVAARAIVASAWRSARTEGRRIVVDDSVAPRHWLFRSVTRPVVALLTTTAAVAPDDPRLDPLFESMLQIGRSERSWNTIDQALVADAVVAMLRRRRPGDSTVVAVTAPSTGPRARLVAGVTRSDTARMTIPPFMLSAKTGDSVVVGLKMDSGRPVYYAATLFEVPTARPVRADDEGISVERWYERYDDPRPVVEVREGELVRVRIRVTVPADREFVVIDDPLPAGLEAVDLSLRTSSALPPFEGAPRIKAEEQAEGPVGQRWRYGSWDGGWWVPWEHREIRDDRVVYFARQLWKGSYLISYVARATTAGTFVRPPAHAEEMYNPALHGRSDGGWFTVSPAAR